MAKSADLFNSTELLLACFFFNDADLQREKGLAGEHAVATFCPMWILAETQPLDGLFALMKRTNDGA